MLICINIGFVFLDTFFSIVYRILILYIVLVLIEHKIKYSWSKFCVLLLVYV